MFNVFVAKQLPFLQEHLLDSAQIVARGRSILEVLHSIELVGFVGTQGVVYFLAGRLVLVMVVQEVFEVVID